MWQQLKNKYHLTRSLIANVYYRFPAQKLTVIGITGTSGKTTTTLMVYEMLKAAGKKVSVLSTLKAVIGGKEYDTGFHVTTPDPHVLPKYLRQAVNNGDTHFVLEVSSHALDQNRAAFVPFTIGVLTSFAHEHLDYHKTLENYAKAKFKLLHASKTAVLPVDVLDDSLKNVVQFDKLQGKMVTFGLENGVETQKKWQLKLRMPGDYNILNALAAATTGSLLSLDKTIIKQALEDFSGVQGRFEEIKNDKGLRIIIDFAHKPDALEAVLLVARKMVGPSLATNAVSASSGQTKQNGRVIVLFGCASERDTLKRPIMGKISGELADISVLTDEDPRREDRMKIINEIAEGCTSANAEERTVILNESEESSKRKDPSSDRTQDDTTHVFYKIPDRQEAITFIIQKLAKKGDVILLCGKGHEQSMNYNGVEKPWSEHAAVKNALDAA